MIGKIERIPLREVWKHEARDLTLWLEENIDVVNDALDMRLSHAEREQNAGAFSVDIVAEDESGHTVVIENQLTRSDHDHLGKLLTYLAAYEAKAAIWVVSDPRPEHVGAVTWLNESASADFYLVKLEAIRIGDSPPAPLLTKIVGPSEEVREVGKTKKELAGRHETRFRFWEGLLKAASQKTKLHSTISPGQYHWAGTSAGVQGLGLNYVVRQHDTSVELYIDKGKGADEENQSIFDRLFQKKEKIEEAFGGDLEWDKVEGRRACRIRYTLAGGYVDEEEWERVYDEAVDAMIRLEKALRSHIRALK